MPLPDIPLSFLVLIFLTIFVLIGIQPTFRRTALKIRRLIESKARSGEPFAPLLDNAHSDIFPDSPSHEPMNDFEIIVLRRIAMARGKALSRKQINEQLLFGDAVLDKTLRSLYMRRMIALRISRFLGQRFVLSKAGHHYASEQGYIVQIQDRKGLL